jgi:hypothetical protein
MSSSIYADNASGSTPWKQVRLAISMLYTKLTQERWWDRIGDLKLFLGAIPLTDKGHLHQLLDLRVNHVISLLEPFELEMTPWHIPVSHGMWHLNGVETSFIRAEDYLGLSLTQLKEGIELLHRELSAGKTVYIHCKGGRGRSASVVIGYFMRYHNMTFEQAHAYVKHYRPQINLNAKQREPLEDLNIL